MILTSNIQNYSPVVEDARVDVIVSRMLQTVTVYVQHHTRIVEMNCPLLDSLTENEFRGYLNQLDTEIIKECRKRKIHSREIIVSVHKHLLKLTTFTQDEAGRSHTELTQEFKIAKQKHKKALKNLHQIIQKVGITAAVVSLIIIIILL